RYLCLFGGSVGVVHAAAVRLGLGLAYAVAAGQLGQGLVDVVDLVLLVAAGIVVDRAHVGDALILVDHEHVRRVGRAVKVPDAARGVVEDRAIHLPVLGRLPVGVVGLVLGRVDRQPRLVLGRPLRVELA